MEQEQKTINLIQESPINLPEYLAKRIIEKYNCNLVIMARAGAAGDNFNFLQMQAALNPKEN